MTQADVRARARSERKRRGLTQEQIAREVGMGTRAYQMFEAGHTTPQPANMQAIVAYLGLEEATATSSAGNTSNGNGPRVEADWPPDVQVFLDMLGAYLLAMPEASRLETIHDVTRQIFSAHREGAPE